MVASALANYNSSALVLRPLTRDNVPFRLTSKNREQSLCPIANIASMDIRIVARNLRNRSHPNPLLARTTPMAQDRSTCREPIQFRAARSAEHCWGRSRNRLGNVQSALLSCIRASSAHTSIHLADSSACKQCLRESQKKTPAMNAPSTPSACAWKSRRRQVPRQSPIVRARHSIICSKTEEND